MTQMERTLVIIKPHVLVETGGYAVADIIKTLCDPGLNLVQIKQVRLNLEQALYFYRVHRERRFYELLARTLTVGPCIAMVFEGNDAIVKVRERIGPINPKHYVPGTLRYRYGKNFEEDAVAASDSPETAEDQIAFFFPEMGLLGPE